MSDYVTKWHKYQVVEADYPAELRDEVNAQIRAGWQPIGGVALLCRMNVNPARTTFYQAMVLE